MSIGMEVSSRQISSKAQGIIAKVKKIVRRKGLDDETWAEAISSQYFLLCLAKQLDLNGQDYNNLVNKCLEPLTVTYDFEFKLDNNKLLITPAETKRIIQAIKREDKTDPYFKRAARMQAGNIDPQLMYYNFHFGLLVRNVSSKESDVLNKVKFMCLDKLTSNGSLDIAGGWYPYRVPWITGRILISLKDLDYSGYQTAEKLNGIIDDAIDSLYRRINEDKPYWRSGVGDWVSKWESTALCLEALYVWDSINAHDKEIEKIIEYAFDETQLNEWLNVDVDFSEANNANAALSAVTFASVVYRVTEKYYPECFDKHKDDIIGLFAKTVNIIEKQDVSAVQQYCTLPQILYYIVAAFRQNVMGVVK